MYNSCDCSITQSAVCRQILHKFTIICTLIYITELLYLIYVSSYCRITPSVVHHQLFQKENIRCTSLDIADFQYPQFACRNYTEIHYPPYVRRYCRITLNALQKLLLKNILSALVGIIAELHCRLNASRYYKSTLFTIRQVDNAEFHYELYIRSKCRTTIFDVSWLIFQNYTTPRMLVDKTELYYPL